VALAIVLPAAAPAAAGTEHPDPDGDRLVELERRTVPFEGRIVPFNGAVVTEGDGAVAVALDGDVLFEFDSDALTVQAEATLTELVAIIDDRLDGDTITIVGHTDAVGDDDYNLELSLRRAEAVRSFLEPRARGVTTFVVEGRGETEPVAPNETAGGADDPEGRRRNRRVEVAFPASPADAVPPSG
jgi:outer membrane protein OmpA-like peptidoglycan-associated protein